MVTAVDCVDVIQAAEVRIFPSNCAVTRLVMRIMPRAGHCSERRIQQIRRIVLDGPIRRRKLTQSDAVWLAAVVSQAVMVSQRAAELWSEECGPLYTSILALLMSQR